MTDFLPVDEQLAILKRGVVDLIDEKELAERLAESRKSGRPLRVKFGIDPSAPDIHVGHTVPLRKLRQFQQLGHQVIVLWGTATAMVGDPTGKNKTRPQLTRDDVEHNKQTYRDQVQRVLDMDTVEQRENGEWFLRQGFMDAVSLSSRYTVAQMLERDSFRKRYKAGEPISIHELLYPLLQGWDSVELQCDIEIGGTDQLFNLMVGRELQRQSGQAPQSCMTTQILEGTDGEQKMSKSLGNAIGVQDPPKEMFGKSMRVPDDKMGKYFTLLTDKPEGEVEALLAGHPRAAKVALAKELITIYHDAQAAEEAEAEFNRMFREGGTPDDVPKVAVGADALVDGAVALAAALKLAGLCASNGEGRRLVQGGGVRVDGEKAADPMLPLVPGSYLLQVGKRKAAALTIG